MKSNLGLVVAGLLSLTLNVSAQSGGNGLADSTNNQNPFGGGGGGSGPADSASNQNPFGGGGGGGGGIGTDPASSQDPFGGGGAGAGPTDSASNQNPFGGGNPPGGSGGGGTTPPGGGNNPPRLDQGGCPATRAVAPAGQALSYTSSPICPTGKSQSRPRPYRHRMTNNGQQATASCIRVPMAPRSTFSAALTGPRRSSRPSLRPTLANAWTSAAEQISAAASSS